MNSVPPPSTASSDAVPAFPLLWTLAMSGHRRLPDEAAARAAIRLEVASLKQAATEHHAKLTAVSSIALGADLLFAEECLAAGLPWKCLLPFPKAEFRKDDFTEADWARVEACLSKAYRVEELMPGIPGSSEVRNAAYGDCGYRMVEQADVIMLLWNGKPAKGTGGTAEVWDYARTLSKPVWHWNPETAVILRAGWPGDASGEWPDRMLFKSRVTPLVQQAAKLPDAPPGKQDARPSDPLSTTQQALTRVFAKLDRLALQKQGDAQRLMQKVVLAHLLATTAAALSVTVVANGCWHSLHELPFLAIVAALTFSLLVLAKPVLAALAMRWEHQLHHLQARDLWVEARVAAELCRSALTCWRFPQAPLALFDEEDFPHFKRLVRSLRIARETEPSPNAAVGEAEAIDTYIKERIDDQIGYFRGKHLKATAENKRWQRKFSLATWFVIIVGSLIGIVEATTACCTATAAPEEAHAIAALHSFESVIACLLIVAPFYASYALAMLAISDCRRRRDRYARLTLFLERQKKRLRRVKPSASRIAVVENTERMLLEELHEWYSVMREVRV